VIAPSKVQALVDTAGNVSPVLLESSANAAADQIALQLARNLRFAPAPRLMFGEIIFTWHTVPVTATNAP
jgi:outer membrane biosynthesis protein TonB